MKALVVDDARVARMMIANMMGELGFSVETAEHGEDALAQLDPTDLPEAIVTDWNMPVMDGAELAKAVRSDPTLRHIPILMISSESDPRRVVKALLAGVDEYLFKPVDRAMLKERLEVMGVYTTRVS